MNFVYFCSKRCRRYLPVFNLCMDKRKSVCQCYLQQPSTHLLLGRFGIIMKKSVKKKCFYGDNSWNICCSFQYNVKLFAGIHTMLAFYPRRQKVYGEHKVTMPNLQEAFSPFLLHFCPDVGEWRFCIYQPQHSICG